MSRANTPLKSATILSGGGNPARQLPNFLNAIRKYREFSVGSPLSTKDADRIREHVLSEYVEPAREQNDGNVELIVKPVNDALGLKEAWPNICQAMKGKKFQELARGASSTIFWRRYEFSNPISV